MVGCRLKIFWSDESYYLPLALVTKSIYDRIIWFQRDGANMERGNGARFIEENSTNRQKETKDD